MGSVPVQGAQMRGNKKQQQQFQNQQTCIRLINLCKCDLIRFTLNVGGWGKR